MIDTPLRRAATAGLLAACLALASCASSSPAAGGRTPVAAARGYLTALLQGHRNVARSFTCPSGWRGRRSFGFVDATRSSVGRGTTELLREIDPVARRVADGWTVRPIPHDGPRGIPAFRVVASGRRYLVCGYR